MSIRAIGIVIFSAINGIRVFPLYLLWKLMLVTGNKEVSKFIEDLKASKCGFFTAMYLKPQYKMLLYARIGYASALIKWLCGSYPITIDSKNHMNLGKGVWMEHPHGSHLHAAVIGDFLTIKHNVTIGMHRNQLPVIGNNVFCGVGSCILGGVIIGNNVKIGANCVVLKNVPDDATVIGNPARIVKIGNRKVDIPL